MRKLVGDFFWGEVVVVFFDELYEGIIEDLVAQAREVDPVREDLKVVAFFCLF